MTSYSVVTVYSPHNPTNGGVLWSPQAQVSGELYDVEWLEANAWCLGSGGLGSLIKFFAFVYVKHVSRSVERSERNLGHRIAIYLGSEILDMSEKQNIED